MPLARRTRRPRRGPAGSVSTVPVSSGACLRRRAPRRAGRTDEPAAPLGDAERERAVRPQTHCVAAGHPAHGNRLVSRSMPTRTPSNDSVTVALALTASSRSGSARMPPDGASTSSHTTSSSGVRAATAPRRSSPTPRPTAPRRRHPLVPVLAGPGAAGSGSRPAKTTVDRRSPAARGCTQDAGARARTRMRAERRGAASRRTSS